MAERPPMMAAPAPPTAPMAPAAAAPAPSAPGPTEGGMDEATPEEQAMYTRLVMAGLDMVVPEGQEQVTQQIMQSLQGQYPEQVGQMFAEAQPPIDANPLDAAAVTGTIIVMMAEGQLESGGEQIPNDIVFHAGAEILEYIINVSDAAGIHDFSEEDIEKVTYRAMDLYRTAAPRADQDALAGEFQEIVAADKAGNLGTVLPGLGERGKAAPPAQQQG